MDNHVVDSLVLQSVPVRHGKTVVTVTVSALPTGVDGLVITPAISLNPDGTMADFSGYSTLIHAATGRSIHHGSSYELRRIAAKLAEFDWTFTDPDHFSGPDNAETLAKIKVIIRAEQTEQGDGSRIHLMGDSEEMATARGTAPAHTLLREHIDHWLTATKDSPRYPDDANKAEVKTWYDHIAWTVEAYGVIYLLAALRKVAPDVADAAARNLFSAWDSGELGEWVYQWGDELTAGKPLTLYGIPDADPLVPAEDSGFPT